MLKILLTTALCLATTCLLVAQAPQAADPATRVRKPRTTKTSKMPTLALRTRKKTGQTQEVPDLYRGRVLAVGSGGGVRGGESAYYLLDDGRLFSRKPGEKGYTFIGTQTAANTKKVFWSVEDRCAIRKTTYNKPGNTYRFVQWKKGTEKYRVTWATGDKDVPGNFEQVYKGFMGMLTYPPPPVRESIANPSPSPFQHETSLHPPLAGLG